MPTMIVMEEDSPSAHSNRRLPVLDMEFWVEDNTIYHQFYKKPMASRKVTMARSALSTSQKRNILVQEGLRRLSNYSPNLPWSSKVLSLNLLCIDMKDCEHYEGFRCTIISRVVGKYKQNLANHNSGVKSMFRTKEEREEFFRTNGGKKTKSTWYRGDGTTTRQDVGMAYLDTEHFYRKDKDGQSSKVDKWSWKGKRDPSMMQKRRMIASMMETMVKTIMMNHCYQFDGRLFLQQTGGPIGLELSGVLARLVMLKFDHMYLDKLSKHDIELVLYQRYVDDINMAVSCPPPGLRFRNSKLSLVPDFIEEDRRTEGDVRTAILMREIANSVMPTMIVMEEDSPSAYSNEGL